MTDIIPAFQQVSDVSVNMTVEKPKAVIGLGNLLILNRVDKPATIVGSNTSTPSGSESINLTATVTNSSTDTPVEMTNFDINETGLTGNVGDTKELRISNISPENFTNGKITVTSDNSSVATVSPAQDALSFKVNFLSEGPANINVNSEDGGVTKTITVVVKESDKRAFSPDLSLDDISNGLLMRKVDTITGAVYREYKNIDAVEVDYPQGSNIYEKASSYFTQANHSDRVAVLDYTGNKTVDTLKDFWFNNWTFAIVSDSVPIDDMTVLSNVFESNKNRFLVLQPQDLTVLQQLKGQNYTIGVLHSKADEAMDAALVGAIATKPVGSVTWKFKQLEGVTPDEFTAREKALFDSLHLIAYAKVNGVPETTEGTVLSGDYIDSLHGDLWIETNIQSELQNVLQIHDKVPYETSGINLLKAKVSEVLQKGWEQGIILTTAAGKGDYVVNASPREDQPQKDLSNRHYAGISFKYHRSGAIHTVTVNGIVQSDTFTD